MVPARLPRSVWLPATALLLGIVAGCSGGAARTPAESNQKALAPAPLPSFAAPPTAAGSTTDDYHGTVVADPYRWLEDQDGEATAGFVAAQNAASRAFLDALPERAAIRDRLRQLWNFPRRDAPRRAGEFWFHSRNDGLQNQSVVYVDRSPDGDGEVLLDPNALSPDGTTALTGFEPSPDGTRAAYAVSASGSDWREWRVLDVVQRTPLADTLRWSKFAGVAWTKDGQGFFYQRFPAANDGEVYQAATRNAELCYHRLGTAQSEDRVVYARKDEPNWMFQPEVTENGRFLVLRIGAGSDRRNRIACVDLDVEGWPVQPLLWAFDATYDFLDHDGDTFWFRTDKDAKNGRLVAVDRGRPEAPWTTVVAEGKEVLRGARLLGGHFVCHYLSDASSRIVVHRRDGTVAGEMKLPAIGTVGAFSGKNSDAVAYCTFASFVHAPAVLRHDFTTGKTDVWRPGRLDFDHRRIVTERRFLQSRDGTRLCLFLVHKKGIRLDGSNPTYLYGYGGFNSPMSPYFSVQNLVLVERGGVYAQAVLRGGGEYGESWHQAGMLGRKQNVFDDFAACAEFLQRNGYCDKAHLAIGGGSNGGLLVGALLTQRPGLIGAAIPEVGVMDMLRYHKFTIGWAWAAEYGTSDVAEQFAWLRAYSPLHNIVPGTAYPPTLVMTGDHDDRVLPGHSYKFAAALQAAQGGKAPILLRIATKAGHGAGKPVEHQIEEAADRLAFLAAVLGRDGD